MGEPLFKVGDIVEILRDALGPCRQGERYRIKAVWNIEGTFRYCLDGTTEPIQDEDNLMLYRAEKDG